MSAGNPLDKVWWLVSRASGVLALVLISLSVLIGLAMAARAIRRPGLKRSAVRLHEQTALIALAAIGLHGLALLGDGWLRPGLRGILIPGALSYRPALTGLGIVAGYLALLLGPSFYLRRRIGARRWRKLHRATVLVWVMSAVHALGAGSDSATVWLRGVALAPVAPIAYLLALRLLGGRTATAERSRQPIRRRARTPAAGPTDATDGPSPAVAPAR